MSFMRWQLRRGVLQPPSSDRPGSPWWRAVNERILRDGCETVALSGNLPGPASSRTVDYWMSFADYPAARAWYRAHNASVVAAYLDHRDLAEAENEAERFFMNVVLCRVLYSHALVAAPRMSLGWLRPLAPCLGDPRLGMTGIFLQLSRVLPDEYPLSGSVRSYLRAEHGFGRLVDYGVIVPRLQQLYEWSAHELAAPRLLDFVRDGAMTYAWSWEDRGVWQPPKSFILQLAHRALPAQRRASARVNSSELAVHAVKGSVRTDRAGAGAARGTNHVLAGGPGGRTPARPSRKMLMRDVDLAELIRDSVDEPTVGAA
jgi:hypothetical protein